jgi:neutral ceramidase
MRRSWHVVTAMVLGACLEWVGTAGLRAEGPRVGAAAVVITPPRGTPMAGYYFARGAEGVHDDLFAKAIVIESGGSKAALVALDLISTTRDLVEEARHAVEVATGVRGDAVMISATHAHTGPVLSGRGVREIAMGGQSELARAFRAGLPKKIAEAVRLAESLARPSVMLVGHGRETSIAFNRRYHMTDGTVGWNPGKLNPKVLKPAGTIDPDVAVVSFESAENQPVAAYINYAVHLDNVGGQWFSADLPYTLGKLLADVQGPDLVTVFTAGCCGDVNHIDVNWSRPQKGFENAARMGTILAAEVLRTWPRLKTVRPAGLRTKSEMVRLAVPEVSQDDVAKARDVVARRDAPKSAKPTFLESVQAFKVLDVAARNGRPLEVEVQVVAMGDEVAWVSLPGEIFVELGLAIKQDSPFPSTIIAELANGSIGYVPSRRAYAQGNYEVVSARCAEGSGERLVDAALRLLSSLYAEANPKLDTPKPGS